MTFPVSGLAAGVVGVAEVAGVVGLAGVLALGAAVVARDDEGEGEGAGPGFTAGLQAVRVRVPTAMNPKIETMSLPDLRG